MIRYKDIQLIAPAKYVTKPCKRLSQAFLVLFIFSFFMLGTMYFVTSNGLVKHTKPKQITVPTEPAIRSFIARKPKVYRTSDIDMDPLRIASPYYEMEIPENSSCTEKVPVLSRQKLPMTALISYPGSGSTWLRHLVQQLTGIATGSSICKKEWKKSKSFSVGECLNNNKVILVNTHDKYKPKKFEKKFQKLIVLYRDPFDTLRSAYTMKHPGHSESVDSEIFNVRGWYEFIRDHTTFYEQYYIGWMEAQRPLFLIYYDDLVNNLQSTLKKLALFLEWRVSRKDMRCTLVTSQGHFLRRHVHNITNSEIFVGKLWKKLEETEMNIAEIIDERRKLGHIVESGDRMKKIVAKAEREEDN